MFKRSNAIAIAFKKKKLFFSAKVASISFRTAGIDPNVYTKLLRNPYVIVRKFIFKQVDFPSALFGFNLHCQN